VEVSAYSVVVIPAKDAAPPRSAMLGLGEYIESTIEAFDDAVS
jgi:hypothetical protein